jgi:hypothetical protein
MWVSYEYTPLYLGLPGCGAARSGALSVSVVVQ